MSADRQPRWIFWATRGEALIVFTVAIACLAFQLWLPSTHIPVDDYEAVAKEIALEAAPEDAIILVPWWAERARLYLPEQLQTYAFQDVELGSFERHPRIWVVVAPGLPRANVEKFEARFHPDRHLVRPAQRFGKLELRLYKNERSRPMVVTASDAIASARVYLEQPNGNRTDCAWNGTGHVCPGGRLISREWHDVHFEPRRCVRFDPPGGPTRLVLAFPAVPSIEHLVIEAGYIWESGAHRDGVTDTEVGYAVGDRSGSFTLERGNELLHRVDVGSAPDGATIRVWTSSPNPTARQVCLDVTGYGALR